MIKSILVLLMLSTPVFAAETICETPTGEKHKIESVDNYDDLIIDGTYFYISDESYEDDDSVVTILGDGKYKKAYIVVEKHHTPDVNAPKSTLIIDSPQGEIVSDCF